MEFPQLPVIIAVIAIGFVYIYWQLNTKNQELEEEIFYLKGHINRLSNPISTTDSIVLDSDSDSSSSSSDECDIEERVLEIHDNGYDQDSEENDEPRALEDHEDSICEIKEEKTPAEDVVITKISHCPHILQSGKNKGYSCGKICIETGYCKNHSGPTPLY